MSLFFVIIFFSTFLGFLFFLRNKNSKVVKKELNKIQNLNLNLNLSLQSIRCKTFTSGTPNSIYLFKLADLYFYENAFLIVGHFKIGKYKFYKTAILLSNNNELINNPYVTVTVPKRTNLHSFNKDVYIEFGESSFSETNVEVLIKNLNEEQKNLIKI